MTAITDELTLDAEELDTIEAIARNGQTGRVTPYEIRQLVMAYRKLVVLDATPLSDTQADLVERLLAPIPDVQEFSTPIANDDPDAPMFDPLRVEAAAALTSSQARIEELTADLNKYAWERDKAREERDAAERRAGIFWESRLATEQNKIAAAIGSVRWMDPPDGGDVTLAEQVRRMRGDLEVAEARLKEAEKAARRIIPYLDWTIGPESLTHHPTMPSAVAAFKEAFPDRARSALKGEA